MTLHLDADKRKSLAKAREQVREIMSPAREAAKIARAKNRKATKAARSEKPMRGQRAPREEDAQYLAWIRGLKCIGCIQDGTPSRSMRSEAAHVRFGDARAGWAPTRHGPEAARPPDPTIVLRAPSRRSEGPARRRGTRLVGSPQHLSAGPLRRPERCL